MGENSNWSVSVPWQEGSPADFAEFPLKLGPGLSSGEEKKSTYVDDDDLKDDVQKKFEEFNRLVETESEDEDDPEEDEDPGEESLEERILWAAQYNKMDIAREMLTARPGLVGVKDQDLYTPLHRASYNGHLDMVRFLVRSGADPLALTHADWTCLHSAAKWNNHLVVEYLLSVGVPVNPLSEGGQTPLHLAAMSAHSRETIELLLMHPDADVTIVNQQGDTAQDVAVRNGPLGPLFDAATPRSVLKYKEQQ